MQWLSNFYQSFYSSRIDHHPNFIIFGAKELKIWFKQVCMHLKTHFKFLFNSSKISTSYAHVIFLLNTRLPCESNKIWVTPFGSTNKEIQNSQNSIEIYKFELSYHYTVTDAWDPRVSRARWSATQNRGDGTWRRGDGLAHRRWLLQRHRKHRRDLCDEVIRLVLPARPKT